MTKIYYRYNSETCKYEPIVHSRKVVLKKLFRFYLIALTIAGSGFAYYSLNHLSFDEISLKQENEVLKAEWEQLQTQINVTSNSLAVLENEDDNYYRVVLDMKKLDQSIRHGGAGGRER